MKTPLSLKSPGIALSFWHQSWRPQVFTEALGLAPTLVREPDVLCDQHAPVHAHYPMYWSHQARAQSEQTLELDLEELLFRLRPQGDFLKSVRHTGGSSMLSLTWSVGEPRAFELSAGVMWAIADYQFHLGLEVFGERNALPTR